MAGLTQETIRLLDRLFNLKGESNIIINEISDNISDTKNAIDATSNEQKDNEVKKLDCEGRLSVFNNQKDAFEAVFEGLDDHAFEALREIGINLEIGTMLETISQKAPEFCEELNRMISNYQEAIAVNKDTKISLESKLNGLESDKAKAEEDREKLVSLLEQSLSSDDIERESLTANYVKKILSLFGIFSQEEISTLAKLIIFPDEGLYEYNASYDERLAQGLVGKEDVPYEEPAEEVVGTVGEIVVPSEDEVIEIKNDSPEEREEQDEEESRANTEEIYGHQVPLVPTEDAYVSEDGAFDLSRLNAVREDLAELSTSYQAEETNGEEYHYEETTPVVEEEPKNDLVEFLSSIGIEADKFTEVNDITLEDVQNLLNDADHDLMTRNYELLRSINIYDDTVYKIHNNHLYITDSDLSKKVTILRAKGISEATIKSLIEDENSGLREGYDTIEKRLNAIEKIDSKLTDENVTQISLDMEKYLENYNILVNSGFELEEKELRNYAFVLLKSDNVKEDVEVLKDYLISIVRKNGKYDLGVFWKNPYELTTSVDDLIEADLEDLITTNPEALSQESDEILRRVAYCKEKGLPVIDENDSTSYCDYIVNYIKFGKEFGQNVYLPELVNRDSINNTLPSIIGNGDFTEILVGTLNNYYNEFTSLKDTDLSEEAKTKLEELNNKASEILKATPTGKYTYKIGNVCVSKIKLERHLTVLLNALVQSGQSIDGVEKEILLTAALYNLRQDEETLRKMVSECLGFNQADAIGGMTL